MTALDTTAYYFDTPVPLTGVIRAGTPLLAGSDSITSSVQVTLSDTGSPLFHYLDSMHLSDSTLDTSVVSLALLSANGADSVFSVDKTHEPQITFFGRVVPVYAGAKDSLIVQWNGGALKPDSVKAGVRFLESMAGIADDSVYAENPAFSTIYYRSAAGTGDLPAGYFRAVFKVRKDSLFSLLNPDSVDIIKAEAVFRVKYGTDPVTGKEYSFLKDQEAVKLQLECRLFLADDTTQVVPAFSLISFTDAIQIINFSPDADSLVRYPISKFIIALTDPKYADVSTIDFTIRPVSSDYTLISRIVFEKRVDINFQYTSYQR
jgi:hypothetical protein